MATTEFTLGLHDVGDGCLAYLQPDGGWGWSNAGLIVGDGQSMLVDTLFDLRLTARMLDTMDAHTSRAPIVTVVNTHANGDHCYGNSEATARFDGVEIVASSAAASEPLFAPVAHLHVGPVGRTAFLAADIVWHARWEGASGGSEGASGGSEGAS